MANEELKEELIGKTKILIGDNLVDCTIRRNKKGNLLIIHDSMDVCPNGTTSEFYNEELIISPYYR